jgi:hypothetical protein
MKKRIGFGFALMLLACTALAAGPSGVRKQVEASMLVTGTIGIAPDGTVSDSTLDSPEKLPPGIMDFVQKQVSDWRFEPIAIDGRPVHAQTKMSVRVVSKKLDAGDYMIEIRSATFGDPKKEAKEQRVTSRHMSPPRYPVAAAKSGVSGTVYLLLRIGRDGRVEDVAAEQVNLRNVGSDGAMTRWRRVLSDAAKSTARQWQFVPPTQGDLANEPYWVLRTPVDFMLGLSLPKYGSWQPYVPGPRETPGWGKEKFDTGSDALADGGVYMLGVSGPRLLTQLGGT